MNRTSIRRPAAIATALVLGLTLAACGNDEPSTGGEDITGAVAVDGSSTVYPMSNAAAELLTEEHPKIETAVGFAGTGGGFERFCAGETDISDASRPIKEDEEAPVCADAGIEYTELLVATDALTVAVNPDLAVDCLTVDQLIELFGPKSKVDNWKDLDPSFPDEKVSFYFPGADSGTYDYMAADVVGDDSEVLRDEGVESSEDDNVLVQGISGTKGAVGFFGYTYYEENTDAVKALEIDNGAGCVAPSAETAQAGDYAPLARPLFIYVNNASYADKPAVKAYVDFYIENLSTIADAAKFIPLNEDDYAATQEAVAGIGS
ncbi:MAG TPA: PstS family phosphate ABC transporter substrate-binding protein [Nocardioidaceae bacterium]|nr:PstS family phosphate ABC transporter substrate-binding protein [Nocardioidaceae bacterium]